MNRPRWLSFLLIFFVLTFLWISLAAAASPQQSSEIAVQQPMTSVFQPGNTTFGITVGAIVLVAIVLTSAAFRSVRGS
jgi:hypothetical protein